MVLTIVGLVKPIQVFSILIDLVLESVALLTNETKTKHKRGTREKN